MKKQTLAVSAPGKVILAGEHAVVYGYPALVTAVSQRVTVSVELERTKQKFTSLLKSDWQNSFEHVIGRLQSQPGVTKVTVSSDLPLGKGMGSSAALAVCLAAVSERLLNRKFDLAVINELAYELEKFQHGTPSGVDNSIATFGEMLWYRKESAKLKVFSPLTPQVELPTLIAIDSGLPSENTKEMIQLVARLREGHKSEVDASFQEIEQITRSWLRQIQNEEAANWKELIQANHRALLTIKVVSPVAEMLVQEIEKFGGAAKIIGAGGATTGSGILLAYHSDPQRILSWAQQKNIPAWPLQLGQKGVREEIYE